MPYVVEGGSNCCSYCKKDFDKTYNVKNILQCMFCNNYLHVECTKVRTSEKLKNIRRDIWKCDSCTDKYENDPMYDMMVKIMIKQNEIIAQNTEIHAQFSKITKLETKANEHAKSLEFISKKFDDFVTFTQETKHTLADHNKKLVELENDNSNLKTTVESLKARVEELEQRSRNCNIEITNIPETTREDPVLVVVKIGEALGVVNPESAIQVAHRVPSKRSPKPLIVNFVSRKHREEWMQAYRKKKGLSAEEINNNFPKQRVYINDHLAPHMKRLFGEVKSCAKQQQIKYVWSRDGKIYVKKDDNHKVLKINSIQDMNKIK